MTRYISALISLLFVFAGTFFVVGIVVLPFFARAGRSEDHSLRRGVLGRKLARLHRGDHVGRSLGQVHLEEVNRRFV